MGKIRIDQFEPPHRRRATLDQLRALKMARSAHAFVRGSTRQFYEWLGAFENGRIPRGPSIWICGDCHIGNIGPLGNAEGEVVVGIRDLDQTVIGNPAHDLIRLGLSLAMSIRSSDLPGVTTALMIEQLMAGYVHALEHPKSTGTSLRPDDVQAVLRSALQRRWKHLANERIENTDPSIPLNRRFWPVSKAEKAAIAALFAREEIATLLTAVWSRPDDASIRVVDQAYWVKGCSSLGLMRFAVLVRIGKKGSRSEQLCLVDVKQAIAPLAPGLTRRHMPGNQATRIATGARHLSPHLGERMATARLLGRTVFIRELFPQDLKLDLDTLSRDQVEEIAQYLGWVVGRAHARQLDDKARSGWLKTLRAQQPQDLEAPSWLWTSVVELAGLHESAYLDHCRRYSLAVQQTPGRRRSRNSKRAPVRKSPKSESR